MSVHKRVRKGRVRWEATWRESGRGSRQRSKTFDTRNEALAHDAKMRGQRKRGAFAEGEPDAMPLSRWLERWWDQESPAWARSTRIERGNRLDKWIVPYLGSVALKDLGRDRLLEYRSELLKAKSSPTNTNNTMRVLSSALGAAVRSRLLPHNPMSDIPALKAVPRRREPMTTDQVETLRLQLMQSGQAPASVMVSVLCYAGLRPSEAAALTWGAVGSVLLVDRAWSARELRATKTQRARSVELVAPLAADLAWLRPESAGTDELVFPSPEGKYLTINNFRRRIWRPAAEACELERFTPYSGRHTFASLLIDEGRALPYVSAAMGHASQRTTLDHYSHMLASARVDAGQPMVDQIEGSRRRVGSVLDFSGAGYLSGVDDSGETLRIAGGS